MGGFRAEELIEYLKTFPKDAELQTLIASPRDRLIFVPKEIFALSDASVPALCITVEGAESMDEEMVRICEEEERGSGALS